MNFVKRELFLWRRRTTLWVLLGIVIGMAYFGYIDYLNPAAWKQQKIYIDISPRAEEEKEFLYTLLAQTVISKASINIMLLVFPVFIIGMSLGTDIHAGRLRGTILAGMRSYQIFWTTFLVSMLLSLGLSLIGYFVSLWSLRTIWWGRLHEISFLFLLRPFLQIVIKNFMGVSVALFCFCLFGKINLAIPYVLYFFILYILGNGIIEKLANWLAWRTEVPDSMGLRAYFFWDVDQKGIENQFAPIINDPIARKIWGETFLTGCIVLGIVCLVVSWIIFRRYCQRKVT